MEGILKLPFIVKKEDKKEYEKHVDHGILKEISDIKERIKSATSKFNNESDEDLIEACIYELKANEARYDYLIKIAKDSKMSCNALCFVNKEAI